MIILVEDWEERDCLLADVAFRGRDPGKSIRTFSGAAIKLGGACCILAALLAGRPVLLTVSVLRCTKLLLFRALSLVLFCLQAAAGDGVSEMAIGKRCAGRVLLCLSCGAWSLLVCDMGWSISIRRRSCLHAPRALHRSLHEQR